MEERKKLILVITVILSLTLLIGVTVIMTNLKKIAPFGLFTVNVQDKTENNISLDGGGSNGSTNNNSGTADNNSGDNSGSNTEQQSTAHVLQVGNYGIIEDASFGFLQEGCTSSPSHSINYENYGYVQFEDNIADFPSGSYYSLVFLNRLPIQQYSFNVGEVLNDIDPILGLNCLYSWADLVDSSNDGIENGTIQHFYFNESAFCDYDTANYYIFVVGHFEDINNLRNFVVDGYSIGEFDSFPYNSNYFDSTYPEY